MLKNQQRFHWHAPNWQHLSGCYHRRPDLDELTVVFNFQLWVRPFRNAQLFCSSGADSFCSLFFFLFFPPHWPLQLGQPDILQRKGRFLSKSILRELVALHQLFLFFFLHYRQTKKWTSALLSMRRSFSINKTLLDSKSSAPTKSLSDIAVKVKECFLIREKMTGVNRKHGCTHLKTP